MTPSVTTKECLLGAILMLTLADKDLIYISLVLLFITIKVRSRFNFEYRVTILVNNYILLSLFLKPHSALPFLPNLRLPKPNQADSGTTKS